MSELLEAEMDIIIEAFEDLVKQLKKVKRTWKESGVIATDTSTLVKEALERAKPMRSRPGLWLPCVEAHELREVLERHKPQGLDVAVGERRYRVQLYGEGDAFISFWPQVNAVFKFI